MFAERNTTSAPRFLVALLTASFLLAAPAFAQDPEEPADDPAAEAMTEPAQAPAEPAALPAAGYTKGLFLQSPDGLFKIVFNGRVQFRLEYSGTFGGDGDKYAFSIPRARLGLKGHAFTKKLTWKLQLDFGKGGAALKDFYLDYMLVDSWLHVRAGQYKRPWSRQQITSSSKQELVDRAPTDKGFGAGRDLGVMLHNNFEKSPTFEYAVGLFNGTGDKASLSGDVEVDTDTGEGAITGGKFSNVPSRFHPMVVVRVGYNHNGINGYSEADFEGGGLRFAVAGSLFLDFGEAGADESALGSELDLMLKVQGFALTGAFYMSRDSDAKGFGGTASTLLGGHAQAGYLIGLPKRPDGKRVHLQPAFRYAALSPVGDPDGLTHQVGGSFNVYFFKHSVKWQTDFLADLAKDDAGDADNNYGLRSQVQLSF